jgi:hypothetical protein
MQKINLNAKKTEFEWQKTWDIFWIKITPLWFDWLQWILVLGVIGYLAQQTKNPALSIIYAFSYMAFYFYLQGIFYSLEFTGFPRIKTKRAQRVMSLILSGIIAFAAWLLISSVISQIQGKV